ncbi:reverse transcriptase [Phytophthora megakarya]|uniref:Reverse transcriptase n=1 Tax=Phytophthora megakarya TaxID=4795 RepID=A0A225VMW4_9STRA|nr:reverse transcriptase [Phytophthora megakarya]
MGVLTAWQVLLYNGNIESDAEIQDLITLNRLDEILIVKKSSGVRVGSDPNSLREEVVRELWIERIRQAQDEESWIMGLKKHLVGEIRDLTQEAAKMFGPIAMNYGVDQWDLLFYCPATKETAADRDKLMRLVIPETLQQDILHTIIRAYRVVIKGSVASTIGSVITSTGEVCIRVYSDTWGNVSTVKQAREDLGSRANHPIIAMDHIPSLSRSFNGNTELLIFVDLFSGYVIAKTSASRSAQTIAETYEECVFRRLSASEVIRHDREPGFMSDFFKSFNKILGQRQRATMAYRPQANGSLKHQRDWDEYAERLTFAINTARDRIRGETPFYMIHDWDPRSALEAVIPVGSTRRYDRDPRRWRYRMQKYYQQAREQVSQRLREPIADRADTHNDLARPHPVESGSRVWLYLDRLAHLWHGPFRVAKKIGEYAVRLEVAGSTYSIFPVVHVSKIKLVKVFPDQLVARLNGSEGDRVDFDEALLPEDSWIQDRDPDEFEVERISDTRTGKKTRYGRIYREFLVHWRGYEDPTWVDEADFNCGALLYEFLRDRANCNRFGVMQSHEEP